MMGDTELTMIFLLIFVFFAFAFLFNIIRKIGGFRVDIYDFDKEVSHISNVEKICKVPGETIFLGTHYKKNIYLPTKLSADRCPSALLFHHPGGRTDL